MSGPHDRVSAGDVAAIARAFDMDPRDVRADTPLSTIGWTGSATDWLVAANHLQVSLTDDPPELAQEATIADLVARVVTVGRPTDQRT